MKQLLRLTAILILTSGWLTSCQQSFHSRKFTRPSRLIKVERDKAQGTSAAVEAEQHKAKTTPATPLAQVEDSPVKTEPSKKTQEVPTVAKRSTQEEKQIAKPKHSTHKKPISPEVEETEKSKKADRPAKEKKPKKKRRSRGSVDLMDILTPLILAVVLIWFFQYFLSF